ncbi:calmodulin-like isoform X3 [Bolinopsis microptera]|uniref:calmodulin-like isoform X3 n=1 Tax=Bolinopsis microptera TaxID=2820187 RepID=UPI00307A71F5
MHAARVAKDIAKHRNAMEQKQKEEKRKKKALKKQQKEMEKQRAEMEKQREELWEKKGIQMGLGELKNGMSIDASEGDTMLGQDLSPENYIGPESDYLDGDDNQYRKQPLRISRILSRDVHKDPDYERRVQDYTAAFQGMDNDGDGTITFEEFKQLWVKSGFLSNEGDIRILFNQVDVNGDGTISLKEFIELNERYAMPSTEEEIREAFKVFDKDNDGFITSDELKRILTKFGGEALEEAEADEIISYIDTNGDEKIHYEEFLVAMEDCNYMAESNSEVESDIEGEDHDHD